MRKTIEVCDKCQKVLLPDEIKNNEIELNYRFPIVLCNECILTIKPKVVAMNKAYKKAHILSKELAEEIASWGKVSKED